MLNLDNLKALIDQTPEIKALFTTESVNMFSSYDYDTKSRRASGMQLQTIYKQPGFLNWKEQLHFELSKIKKDTFIEKIIVALSHFNGWTDKRDFEELESKLYVLRDHLEEYISKQSEAEIEDDSRIPEQELCVSMLRALTKLQRNHYYNSNCSEDTMNDYIRDILDESYSVKDQTRQGESEQGAEAGEIDIQICCDGFPVVMVEGIKVSYLDEKRLDTHMNKVITKYDPNGCPYVFLVIYTTVKDFLSGYENILNYFSKYDYPFPRETDLQDIDTGYGEIKHAQIILNRNGQNTRVHIWTVHIC